MKVVSALLKYDYGIKERGESLEKKGFLPALEQAADEVIPFWLEENGYYENRVLLQQNLINFVEAEKPDIVFFILMRDEITIDTIEYLSKKFITINWFCDDQWRFDTFTKYVAPKLTYSITTDKYSLSKYYSIGCKNVILSQWASFDYISNMDIDKIEYKYDISFIGAKNPAREWITEYLKKKGFFVECFGAGWNNGRVEYEDIKHIFLHSKINLNLSNSVPSDLSFLLHSPKSLIDFVINKKRIEQIKARNFEIPCSGGFQLTGYVPGLEDYFDIGKEIAIYTNKNDLAMQINYYLHNEDERRTITKLSYKKAENYTYKYRLTNVLEIINRQSANRK